MVRCLCLLENISDVQTLKTLHEYLRTFKLYNKRIMISTSFLVLLGKWKFVNLLIIGNTIQ